MPNAILVILLAFVFTAFLAIGQGIYWAYVGRIERQQEELKRRLGKAGEDDGQGGDVSLFRESVPDGTAKLLGGVGSHIQALLNSSDSAMGTTGFLARVIVAAGVGMLIGGIGSGSAIGLALGVPFGLLPYILLRRAAGSRIAKLVDQIPDALELMARSLQAGMGLSDSFKLVAEEMPMPIAGEFGRVFEEVRFGRDLRDAFDKLIDRNPTIFDLRLFASSVLLQRETGGNLIEILSNIATTVRNRGVFKEKVNAMTSEAKFTALLLGFLPIGVLLVLATMNPTYLAPLFTELLGNLIILAAVSMYCVGGFLMYEVSKVEV